MMNRTSLRTRELGHGWRERGMGGHDVEAEPLEEDLEDAEQGLKAGRRILSFPFQL